MTTVSELLAVLLIVTVRALIADLIYILRQLLPDEHFFSQQLWMDVISWLQAYAKDYSNHFHANLHTLHSLSRHDIPWLSIANSMFNRDSIHMLTTFLLSCIIAVVVSRVYYTNPHALDDVLLAEPNYLSKRQISRTEPEKPVTMSIPSSSSSIPAPKKEESGSDKAAAAVKRTVSEIAMETSTRAVVSKVLLYDFFIGCYSRHDILTLHLLCFVLGRFWAHHLPCASRPQPLPRGALYSPSPPPPHLLPHLHPHIPLLLPP